MPLPVEISALEEVADRYQGLYTEENGKYVLDAEIKKDQDVSGLKNTVNTLRNEKKAVEEVLAQFKAFGDDPDTVKSKFDEMQQQIAEASKTGKADWEAMKAELVKQQNAVLEEEKNKTQLMEKTVAKHLIDATGIKELESEKGSTALLMPVIRSRSKVVKEGDEYVVRITNEDGTPAIDNQGNPLTVSGLVKSLKEHDSYKRAFDSEGTSGGGTPPGGGSAPTSGRPGMHAGGDNRAPINKISDGLIKRGI
jgi:hypothetical protein